VEQIHSSLFALEKKQERRLEPVSEKLFEGVELAVFSPTVDDLLADVLVS
jgi:hypothetical protein